MNKFSYSQINTYTTCPLAYELAYIKKFPQFITKWAAFWTTIHSTLYKFFDIIKNIKSVQTLFDDESQNISLNLLTWLYYKSWVCAWYNSKDDEMYYKDMWEEMLKSFYFTNKDNWWNPYLLETGFKLHMNDFVVAWRFDRVDKWKWIDVEIIDYKTWTYCNKSAWDWSWKSQDLQLWIYALALKQMWFNPIKAYLYLFNKNKKQEFDIKKETLDEIESSLIDVVDGIRSGKFNAKPDRKGECARCRFSRVCVG